jgi:hypothetical protein
MHFLKSALRFLSRQKVFTAINGMGLALCLACCIILSRYLYCQFTPDRHLIDPETCYTIYRQSDDPRGKRAISVKDAKDEYDDEGRAYLDQIVTDCCDLYEFPNTDVKLGQNTWACNLLYADSTLTHFWHYDVQGDAEALTRKDVCWISSDYLAQLGLTPQEALDTTLSIKMQNFRIAGIFQHPDGEEIVNPDIIIPSHSLPHVLHNNFSIIRVHPGFDAEEAMKRLSTFGETERHHIIYSDNFIKHEIVPWRKSYMYYDDYTDVDKMHHYCNATLCWILAGVLLLIFAVGIINFINLNLVLWQRRQHEAGVRRIFGRQKRQICLDLWIEHLVLIAAAILLAWLIVQLSTPYVVTMLGDSIAGTRFDLLLTSGFLLLLPPLAMAYPLYRQLHANPISFLQQRGGSIQSLRTRTMILGFQYFITLTLMVLSLWMRSHLDFLLNQPIGFDANRVLLSRPACLSELYGWKNGKTFLDDNREELTPLLEQYAEKLSQIPCVESFCFTNLNDLPITNNNEFYYNGQDEKRTLNSIGVSESWFQVFGIQLQEGTMPIPLDFFPEKESDGNILNGWLVNRSALHTLGYESLDSAIVRRNTPLIYAADGVYGLEFAPIQGLVGDHYSSHRTLGISPCIYCIETEEEQKYWREDSYIAIRCHDGQQRQLMNEVEKLQKEIFPSYTPVYQWMSDIVDEQYKSDRMIADVYTLFAAIAIIICCLGLLGLSFYDIRQRYREIAIRKAHGAHRQDLYLRLGHKYIAVLLVAFVLSIPVTYLFIHSYTETFVESAPLTPIIYVEAFAIVLLISLLTLIYQLERAARVNVATTIKTD